MKRLIVFIIMILLLVLDNSLCPFFAISRAVPSLLFVFAIAYSIIYGKTEATIVGIFSGVLQDIYFTNCFGINCLVNMICCFIVATIGESIWKEKKVVPVASMFGISIFKYYIVCLILYLIGINTEIIRGVFIAVYNSVIMFFVYSIIFKYYKKEHNEVTWRFK